MIILYYYFGYLCILFIIIIIIFIIIILYEYILYFLKNHSQTHTVCPNILILTVTSISRLDISKYLLHRYLC